MSRGNGDEPSTSEIQKEMKQEESVEQICQDIQKSMAQLIKASNGLPLNDFAFFNTFPGFSKLMTQNRNHILSLMTSLGKNQNNRFNFMRTTDDASKFDTLCDLNDFVLDRVGHSLDEVEGIKKKNEALVVATLKIYPKQKSDEFSSNGQTILQKYKLLGSKIVERPQVSFPDKIDNSEKSPFIPKLRDKPHSLKPLAILPETDANGQVIYPNPYEYEIDMLEPSEEQLVYRHPVEPIELAATPLVLVDSVEKLKEMISELRNVTELAVDLEHHSYRSFQGFTCLIQISSRKTDYIIDALKLRGHLEILNEVFTNPKIVKVLHGAESDVLWLQRDFGVYLVNMFDTFHASKLLGLSRHSLAHLVKTYLQIELNKEFQLIDWRIRPLEDEMMEYARMDTHYLLYIFDVMSNALIQKSNESLNLLRSVYTKSSQTCKIVYRKPTIDKDSHLSLLRKNGLVLNGRQMFALEQLYRWRDKMAREEDESFGYVLPNQQMLQLAQSLPREIQGIFACFNHVPPLVKQHLNELNLMFVKARELPLESFTENKRLSMVKLEQSSVIHLDGQFSGHDCATNIEFDQEENLDKSISSNGDESPLFKFLSIKKKPTYVPAGLIAPFERYTKTIEGQKAKLSKMEEDEKVEEIVEPAKNDDEQDSDNDEVTEIPMEEDPIVSNIRKIRQQSNKKAKVIPHEYKPIDLEAFRPRRGGGGQRGGRGGGAKAQGSRPRREPKKEVSIRYTK